MPSESQDVEVPTVVHGTVTEHGRQLLRKLAERGIGLNTDQKSMRNLSAHSMFFRMAPQHTVSFNDLRYFTVMGHGYAEAVLRRYLSDHDERPLWVSTTSRGDTKTIVKGKASYRINAALNQALRNAGYDAHGRRMSEADWRRHCEVLGVEETSLDPQGRQIAQLYGSVEIIAHEAKVIHQVPFVALREHFQKVVRTFEEVMGRSEDGVPLGQSRGGEGSQPQGKFQRGRPQNGGYQGKPYKKPGKFGQNRPPSRHSQSSGDRGRN